MFDLALGWGKTLGFLRHSGGKRLELPVEVKTNIVQRSSSMYTVHMEGLQFTWDENKARANRRKHGVSFEEAQTAFFDEQARLYFDPDHSEGEDRFILLGVSYRLRVLVVCHCYRESDTMVRIISARKADKQEQADYWS